MDKLMITSMIKKTGAVLICTAMFTTTVQAGTGPFYERNCHYDLYVKADGVRSTLVQGELRAQGRGSKRGYARVNAAKAAEQCLLDAKKRMGTPGSCRRPMRDNPFPGEVTQFDHNSIIHRARRTLCTAAKGLGKTRLRKIEIYVKVRSRSEDVRRECSLPAKKSNVPRDTIFAQGFRYSPYYNVERIASHTCR